MTSLGIGTLRWGVRCCWCRPCSPRRRVRPTRAPRAAVRGRRGRDRRGSARRRSRGRAAPPAPAGAPAPTPPARPAARPTRARTPCACAVAREERQRAQGADLPHQGAPQPAQGDRARRRDRRVARDHPPQERDGQLVPPDQGGLRARRRADLLPRATIAAAGRDAGVRRLQRRDPAGLAHAVRRAARTRATASACSATSRATSSTSSRATPSSRANRRPPNITVVGLREGQHHDPALGQAGDRLPRQRHVGRRKRHGDGGDEEITGVHGQPEPA